MRFIPLLIVVGGCTHVSKVGQSEGPREWPKAHAESTLPLVSDDSSARARLRFASDEFIEETHPNESAPASSREVPLELSHASVSPRPYRPDASHRTMTTQPSLYREGRGVSNDPYHDYRAFQPYDLVTIIITELAEGNRVANTNARSESTFTSALRGLLGLDDWFFGRNRGIDPTAAVDATTEMEFRGQGQTLRSDRLRGTISAVVTEVLPSGVLSVEGKKVITVNGEAQTMVLSGLVRPRDVKSNNTVDSSKVANMKIEFFGEGSIGDVQKPGWLTSFLIWIWPF